MVLHATEPIGSDSDPLAFELDRFERTPDDGLELRGRWFGVRGRRFMRPTLTMEIGGARHRLLADLEHKPWAAAEGEAWVASFSSAPDMDGAEEIELSVASDIIVALSRPVAGAATAPASRPSAPARRRSAPEAVPPARDASRQEPARDRAKVAELERRLRAAESSARDAIGDERSAALRHELEDARAQRDAALRELDDLKHARADREGVVRELGLARERVAELKHQLKKAQVNTEALRAAAQSKFESQRAEVDSLRKQLQSQKALEAERDRLARDLKEAVARRDRIAAQAKTATPHAFGGDSERIARAMAARPSSRAYRLQYREHRWPGRAFAIVPLCVVLLALVLILHLV